MIEAAGTASRGRALGGPLSGSLALPLRSSPEGGFEFGRRRPVEDSLRLVLDVVPGERPLRPEFGCRVHFLEPVAGEVDGQLAAALVEEAVERWLGWLGVRRVDVDSQEAGALRLRLRLDGGRDVRYVLRLRQAPQGAALPEREGRGRGGRLL
jgi:hypothetical protein